MPIYDQSYKRWEGQSKSHAFRWWVVTKYGIKTAFKKKAVRLLFTFALFPLFAGAVYIYGLTHLGKVSQFVRQIDGHAPVPEAGGKVYQVEVEGNPQLFVSKLSKEEFRCSDEGSHLRVVVPEGENSKKILAMAKATGTKIKGIRPPGVGGSFYSGFLEWQSRYLFLLLLVVGAGLIAKDVKFKALQIYLAKPITNAEYILGKLGVVVFFLAMVTLVPGILLFLIQAILVGDSLYFRHYWWVMGAICLYSVLIILSGSFLILALSALSESVRGAASGCAAVFVFSTAVALLLRNSTHNDDYMLVSFRHNWTSVGERIFGVERSYDAPWAWALVALVAIVLACATVLIRRIRGVQVVK